MDKKIAGLLGAAAALTAVNGAEAAAPAATVGLEPAATYRSKRRVRKPSATANSLRASSGHAWFRL